MRIEHRNQQRVAATRGPTSDGQSNLWKNNWTQLLNCAFPDKSSPVMQELSLIADSAEISNI
ncbi:hypothetical protein K0M31_001917 [Melipona bicolor]|uniref:Uncharacterized protein n=1 Tax=Melipona bicolor TaxID=60889 RepID=A0AA40KYB9_9HYME|nr:hypothetical protein K0M31_001917 [Melipona bicolor]